MGVKFSIKDFYGIFETQYSNFKKVKICMKYQVFSTKKAPRFPQRFLCGSIGKLMTGYDSSLGSARDKLLVAPPSFSRFKFFPQKRPFVSEELFVRAERLELSNLAAPDPKSGVSTNFTTPALLWVQIYTILANCKVHICLFLRNSINLKFRIFEL